MISLLGSFFAEKEDTTSDDIENRETPLVIETETPDTYSEATHTEEAYSNCGYNASIDSADQMYNLESNDFSPIKSIRENGMSANLSSDSVSSELFQLEIEKPDTQKALFLHLFEKIALVEKKHQLKLKEIQDSNALLQEENAEILENYAALKKDNETLHNDNVLYTKTINDLLIDNKALHEENNTLIETTKVLSVQNATIIRDNSSIKDLLVNQQDTAKVAEESPPIAKVAEESPSIAKVAEESPPTPFPVETVHEQSPQTPFPVETVESVNEETIHEEAQTSQHEEAQTSHIPSPTSSSPTSTSSSNTTSTSASDDSDNSDVNETIQTLKRDVGILIEKSANHEFAINESKEYNEEMKLVTAEIKKMIYRIDEDLIQVDQYSRRSNLILNGIPNYVKNDDLENACIDIVNRLGYHITEYEVVACHRLKKTDKDAPAPVIMRFTNRKVVEYCMKNRFYVPKLRLPFKLMLSEDLCDHNKQVQADCEALVREGILFKYFTRNGFIKVIQKNGDRPKVVRHINYLVNMFPDVYVT